MDSQQIIYVDPFDSTGKVEAKMKETKKEKIILVLPSENQRLKSIENLTHLRIEAQKLGKKLTVFSSDKQYQRLVEDCGIEIEKSIVEEASTSSAKEVSFRPQIKDIFSKKDFDLAAGQKMKPGQEIASRAPAKEAAAVPQLPARAVSKKSPAPLNFFYVLILLLLIGGVAFSFYYLPKAEITILPVSEKIDFDSNFLVKKDQVFDAEERLLPGTLVVKEKEVEKSFLATGQEKKIEKAKGEIVVYNEDSQSYNFRPDTRFQTSDGKIFRQPAGSDWIAIPKGSTNNPGKVTIDVVADEAGEKYNIALSTFTLPGLKSSGDLYNKIYGKSAKAMSGGFIGETKVVSADDINKAESEMKTLQDNLAEEIQGDTLKELPSGLQFLKDSIVLTKEKITFDKKTGDIGETFKGEAKVSAYVLKFSEEDIKKIITAIVADRVKDGIEVEEVAASLKIDYKISKNDTENCSSNVEVAKCEMEVDFTGEESVAWKIVVEDVRSKIKGFDEPSFESYIKEDMKGKIERADLNLWPFWVNKIPSKENRIFIQIQYGEEGG
ncbi:MAG: hypothetical protein V1841_02110 [Patescibacteria group bacterium]